MKMLKSNLISALSIAISSQKKDDSHYPFYTSDSAFVTGHKQVLEALMNGEYVEIIDGERG